MGQPAALGLRVSSGGGGTVSPGGGGVGTRLEESGGVLPERFLCLSRQNLHHRKASQDQDKQAPM